MVDWDWEREWLVEGPAAEHGEVVMVEVFRKTSFITMGRRIHAPLYSLLALNCVRVSKYAYSDNGMSFEFAASTNTSEVRAMLEHAFLTSRSARSDHSLLMAVLTPGRTYMYGRRSEERRVGKECPV